MNISLGGVAYRLISGFGPNGGGAGDEFANPCVPPDSIAGRPGHRASVCDLADHGTAVAVSAERTWQRGVKIERIEPGSGVAEHAALERIDARDHCRARRAAQRRRTLRFFEA